MTDAPQRDAILEFWTWFGSVAEAIAEELEHELLTDSILDELDRRVTAFGLAWEVGPGKNESLALVITPDGDPDLLERSRSVVALAPSRPGWEFHPARQPRVPPLTLEIHDENGRHQIDATAWRYVLFLYADGAVELVIEQPNLPAVSDTVRRSAAFIALDGLLGEERRLRHVVAVEAVETFDDPDAPRSRLPVLSQHLSSLG